MDSLLRLLKPVVTEKATEQEARGKYQFYVRKEATKVEIREAFRRIYGVSVAKVNIMRTAAKFRTGKTRKALMKKAELKKVIITLKEKKTLDLTKPKLK